jgi:hypothetical protein
MGLRTERRVEANQTIVRTTSDHTPWSPSVICDSQQFQAKARGALSWDQKLKEGERTCDQLPFFPPRFASIDRHHHSRLDHESRANCHEECRRDSICHERQLSLNGDLDGAGQVKCSTRLSATCALSSRARDRSAMKRRRGTYDHWE